VVHGGHTHGDCSSQCNGIDLGEYNTGLHIVALFVVLISSLLGVLLPLFSASFMSKSLFANIFFAAKHFGTGVIISTAFVHLLYHSFIMFSNACLGDLAFEPAAAAISMAGMCVLARLSSISAKCFTGQPY
jgi:zinc transporter 1/2/3